MAWYCVLLPDTQMIVNLGTYSHWEKISGLGQKHRMKLNVFRVHKKKFCIIVKYAEVPRTWISWFIGNNNKKIFQTVHQEPRMGFVWQNYFTKQIHTSEPVKVHLQEIFCCELGESTHLVAWYKYKFMFKYINTYTFTNTYTYTYTYVIVHVCVYACIWPETGAWTGAGTGTVIR